MIPFLTPSRRTADYFTPAEYFTPETAPCDSSGYHCPQERGRGSRREREIERESERWGVYWMKGKEIGMLTIYNVKFRMKK